MKEQKKLLHNLCKISDGARIFEFPVIPQSN
jgi:hypothetical protein